MLKDEVKQNTGKRVLIVIGTLSIGGGAEKVAATVGSELTARGHEVHLLTFYEVENKYSYTGIYHTLGESILQSRVKKILRLPQRVFSIYRYIRKNEIDVAISFLEEANFYTLLAKLLGARKIPVIVSVRNNIEKREWPFKLATRLLYPFAESVVSVTKAVEVTLREKFKLQNTTTIYNPLDMDLIRSKMMESLPISYQWLKDVTPLCISIGRLIHQKGQWHLIRAFTEVIRSHPQATLIILGEGEYQSKLEALIESCQLKDRVFLLGKHENVYQFLAAADLFIFSSLWEGMPNTMLEAMAVGLPIVSTDCVSGPREIISPGISVSEKLVYPLRTEVGTLVSPLSEEDIWEAPAMIPLTPEEKQLADEIILSLKTPPSDRGNGSDRFSLDRIIDEWERLL